MFGICCFINYQNYKWINRGSALVSHPGNSLFCPCYGLNQLSLITKNDNPVPFLVFSLYSGKTHRQFVSIQRWKKQYWLWINCCTRFSSNNSKQTLRSLLLIKYEALLLFFIISLWIEYLWVTKNKTFENNQLQKLWRAVFYYFLTFDVNNLILFIDHENK